MPSAVPAKELSGPGLKLETVTVLRWMVRERMGRPSFFVRRMDAECAWMADLRARCRDPRGTSRLMTLPALDWSV